MNDPLMLAKAVIEIGKTSPRTCSMSGTGCQAAECCFSIYMVCVDK
jgi:hypothetical protein